MIKGYRLTVPEYTPVTEMTSVGCRNCRKTWLEEMIHVAPVRVNGAMMIYDKCSECIDSGNTILDGLNLFDKTPQEQFVLAKQNMKPLPTPTPSEGKTLKKSGNSPIPKCQERLCKEADYCICLITDLQRLTIGVGCILAFAYVVYNLIQYIF